MRKGFFVFSLALILAIGAMPAFSPGRALAADKLLVCGVCDKSFYETAVKVVTEMNLADKVTVKKTSCLGASAVPPSFVFKGMFYTSVTA